MHLGVDVFIPLACSPLQGLERQGQASLGMHRGNFQVTDNTPPQGGGSDTSQVVQESRVIWGEACMKSLGDV